MNTAASLLSELRSQGKTIAVIGSILRIVPKPTDPTLIERLRAHKAEVMTLLKKQAEIDRIAKLDAEHNEADRVAKRGYDYDSEAPSHREWLHRSPAAALIRTCREHGVGLRVEADGTLVVGPGAWRTLVAALEQHVDAVAELILEQWEPYDA